MDKSTQQIMFSSKTGMWSTPQDFFDKLSWRFGKFDLDPCASPCNTKCANFFTEAEDGLSKDWSGFTSFVNPPYGIGIDKWIQKGFVMKASEVYFVKGRLKFGNSKNSAPFPSAVVVFDSCTESQIFGAMNR